MNIGVIRFPGTNNEYETLNALRSFDKVTAHLIESYEPKMVKKMDGIYVPGGFSYADCLRAGAIAGKSEIMVEIKEFAKDNKPVFGACNGMQILLEAKLLEGTLLPNKSTRFICKHQYIKIPDNSSYLSDLSGDILNIPIAHFEGNFWTEGIDPPVIAYYSSQTGEMDETSNPNGSKNHIAGISNKKGNIVAMMPHPERAAFPFSQSQDGRKIISKFLEATKC